MRLSTIQHTGRHGVNAPAPPPQVRAPRVISQVAAIACLLAASNTSLSAQETNAPPTRPDYPSFRIISERNIFNPNRSNRSARRADPERQVRIESFTLLGTLSYEKGSFAFFDGTGAGHRKAVEPAGTIAGFKVAAIGPDHVKLDADGKGIELRVGMQMRREDEGEWQMTTRTDSPGSATRLASQAAATNASGADAAEKNSETPAGGDESDILKRLMQKREQELNK